MELINIKASGMVDPGTKPGRIIMKVFLVLGILFLIVAIAGAALIYFYTKDFKTVYGTITELNDEGYPVYEYTVDGETYSMTSTVKGTSFYVGSQHKLAYDPAAPGRATNDVIWLYIFPAVFGFVGLVFIIACTIANAVFKSVDKKHTRLEYMRQAESAAVSAPGGAQRASERPAYEMKSVREYGSVQITKQEDDAAHKSAKYCHICGDKLREGSRFCNNCGAKVD